MGIGRFIERRAADTAQANANWTPIGTPTAYKTTGEEALGHPTVFMAVKYLSTIIGFLDVNLYGNDNTLLDKPSWLRRPNQFMAWFDFISQIITSLSLDGNAYVLVLQGRKGPQLQVLNPALVTPKILPDGDLVFEYGDQHYNSEEVLHFRSITVPGSIIGISPITANRATITRGIKAEELGAELMSSGLMVTGVVRYPNAVKPEDAERIRENIKKRHSGTVKNSVANVLVLSGGAEFEKLTISPHDAQFLEQQKFTSVQIAQMFGLPPFFADPSVTSSWGSGVEQQNIRFVQMTLGPLLKNIEMVFNEFFLPDGQEIKFDLSNFLRGDSQALSLYIFRLVQAGIITANEARKMISHARIDGADQLQIPSYQSFAEQEADKNTLEMEQLKQEIENLKNQKNQEGS